ncbi:histone H1-like [Heptranchias perlo]|uniref:histone H1-like n=1 Tax=Heptranchias perlo TaxID=212740 RepID=UPI00355956ED
MADIEPVGMDLPAPAAPALPPPPLPPPDEAVDIAVAVKKKRRPYRHKKFGCTVAEQIMKAVAATKQRRGLSVAAMKKALKASGYNLEKNNSRVNRAIKSLLSRGSLVHTAGTGASGSVKLSKDLEITAGVTASGKEATRRRVVVKRLPKMPRRPSTGRKKAKAQKKTGVGRRTPTVFRMAAKWKAARMRRVSRCPTETKSAKTPSSSAK